MMKKLSVLTVLLTFAATGAALAGKYVPQSNDAPTIMIGIAVEFGDHINAADIGFTGKVMSSNAENKFVVGAGLTYFPWTKDASGPLGFDVSAGYNLTDATVMAGYDFLRYKPQLSIGLTPTQSNDAANAPSDARLKHDIQLVDTLEDGTKIYSFKYVWSDETYVGVMAQDLLNDARTSQAVVTMANGFYAVNYKALGLRMTTLERWKLEGRKAIAMNANEMLSVVKKAA